MAQFILSWTPVATDHVIVLLGAVTSCLDLCKVTAVLLEVVIPALA